MTRADRSRKIVKGAKETRDQPSWEDTPGGPEDPGGSHGGLLSQIELPHGLTASFLPRAPFTPKPQRPTWPRRPPLGVDRSHAAMRRRAAERAWRRAEAGRATDAQPDPAS